MRIKIYLTNCERSELTMEVRQYAEKQYKNNIELDVKVKRIEGNTTKAKLCKED